MTEPKPGLDVDKANRRARQIAITMLVILAILLLVIKMVRGESDTTFWRGFVTVFFSIGLPAGLFIKGNDTLGNVKRKGEPIFNDLARTYLNAFIAICAVIILALIWYSFIATTDVSQTLASGQEQTREMRYPFAIAAGDISTITSPILMLLYSVELFHAANSLKNKVG